MSKKNGLICPQCDGINIDVFYTCPLQFHCRTCDVTLYDKNAGPGIPVLTKEEAMARRPGLFGMPICDNCSHGPHEGKCQEVCEYCIPDRHVYDMKISRA